MYDCVLLAAGAASRMASPEGREVLKPLLPFGASTLVETAAASALEAGCRVLLVVGNRGRELAALFTTEPYRRPLAEGRLLVVDNPRWEGGMISSIQAALPGVRGAAFFIAHADMPFVGPEAYRALEGRRAERTFAGMPEEAVAASHRGRAGHPVLMPSAWIPAILALRPGDRLKSFLEGRPLALVETGPGALRDIDTPEDYSAAVL
jgi:molybdenum cofactor cytidylyltransferase